MCLLAIGVLIERFFPSLCLTQKQSTYLPHFDVICYILLSYLDFSFIFKVVLAKNIMTVLLYTAHHHKSWVASLKACSPNEKMAVD